MKVIGMIGGTSWESTLEYYRIINETVRARVGRTHSARCLLYTVDFDELHGLQDASRWDDVRALFVDAAGRLERGGADCLLLCANTTHMWADDLERAISMPLIHVADVTATAALNRGFDKLGLLGTRYTMEQDFYRKRFAERFGIEVLVPPEPDRTALNRILYGELCMGVIRDASRREVLRMIDGLSAEGAEAVILGCTEIPLLVSQEQSAVPLLDTLRIHAEAAVDFATA